MVDRIELHVANEVQQMGELEGRDAFGSEQDGEAGDEVANVGDMGEHVVGGGQVGADAARDEPFGCGAAEEGDLGRDAARDRRRRDIGRRLDAERGHAGGEEMAQQIAVVGGDLDHHRARPEAEAVDHRQRVAARVLDPRIRHRREIGVVGEDRRGIDRIVDLDEEACAADARMQRKAPLAPRGDLLGGQVAVGERRLAEIDEGRRQRGAAGAAGGRGGAHAQASIAE